MPNVSGALSAPEWLSITPGAVSSGSLWGSPRCHGPARSAFEAGVVQSMAAERRWPQPAVGAAAPISPLRQRRRGGVTLGEDLVGPNALVSKRPASERAVDAVEQGPPTADRHDNDRRKRAFPLV